MYQWCEFKSRRWKNKHLTALQSNSNTVCYNFQTYIYIYIYIYIYMAAHQYACFERIVSFCLAGCHEYVLSISLTWDLPLTPMSCSGLKRTHITEYSSVYPLSTETNIYISHCMSYTNFPVMLKSASLTDWQNFRSVIVHFIAWTDKFFKINWKWLTCWQRFQKYNTVWTVPKSRKTKKNILLIIVKSFYFLVFMNTEFLQYTLKYNSGEQHKGKPNLFKIRLIEIEKGMYIIRILAP